MKKLLLLVFISISGYVNAQNMDRYFESIRNNSAELTAFFSAMPKGGDLHNHFSGSVYAETYIDYVVRRDYAINEQTLQVEASLPRDQKGKPQAGWSLFSTLAKNGRLAEYKQKLIQKWSVKDYNGVSYPSDKQFFETFPAFDIATRGQDRLDSGLLELKNRAIKEHVSYIETMFIRVPCKTITTDAGYNEQLLEAAKNRNAAMVTSILDKIYTSIAKNAEECAKAHNSNITDMHRRLHMDDSLFTIRYQNYVVRVVPPADVFASLVTSFMSANTSPLIVGVNIVAPEDNEVSMRDYWLHMQMYRFCHAKFPEVKYAMHAGELTLGTVKPEELNWHINAAVRTAGASRIGHGVDIAYEYNSDDLLRYMARNNIAIEINLYSNEFILKVKDDNHPISLYRDFHVPIVICTDDAGVLRSNLTHQYVLLAKRYKDISYHEIKEYVFNSIDYSFIKEEAVKNRLRAQLRDMFDTFEHKVLDMHKYY